MERVDAAILPVVARIFSGDSTSPLTREARTWCGARDGCGFERVVVMERVDATGGESKARMPEMNAQRFCRTQSQQSVHKEARTLCGARDYCLFARVVGMVRFGAAIPPVVARIFSGDYTSPLTREARTWCCARDYCLFAMVAGMERVDATGGASPLPYEKWV